MDTVTDTGGSDGPRVQESPFLQGVNVMQTQPSTDTDEATPRSPVKSVSKALEYIPGKETPDAHPGQLRPTTSIYTLAKSMFRKDINEWRLHDFTTPGSPDGTSILLSIFVDYAATILRPGISISQRESIARVATAVAPCDLLDYMQNPREALHFLDWALRMGVKIPPTMEAHLCPIQAPNLIPVEIRTKIDEANLTQTELKQVVESFVKCYYPKSAATVMDEISKVPVEMLRAFVTEPGQLATVMKNKHKAMTFQPPKWYRLSIHPDVVIHSPPKKAVRTDTWANMPFTRTELEAKMDMGLTQLAGLPMQKIKTHILVAIPKIFDDKDSREGCMRAFNIIEKATPEEITNLIQGESEEKSEDKDNVGDGKLDIHRYYVRLEHVNRQRHEEWTEPRGEILRKWINAVHPVLTSQKFNLVLTLQPYARKQSDRWIYMTPYNLDVEHLEEYIIEKPSKRTSANRGTSRFEIWVKTTCPTLEDMADSTRAGSLAQAYASAMRQEDISVKFVSRTLDNMVPAVMIGGSVETADDEVIEEEISDRLLNMGVNLAVFPTFHVEHVIVGTSLGRDSIKTKCIISRRSDTETIQKAFELLPTPAATPRYLATNEFCFTPVRYPPNDRTDADLAAAIKKQREFTSSIVKTTIYNLNNIAPYHDIPPQVRDLYAGTIQKNTTRTIASIIMSMKYLGIRDTQMRSPVIRVSTNVSGTKLHLTSLKTEAEELIKVTALVAQQMDIWYEGNNFRTLTEVMDAKQHVKHTKVSSPLQVQASTGGSMAKWGEVNEAQLKLEASRTKKELTENATAGINNIFVSAEKTSIYTAPVGLPTGGATITHEPTDKAHKNARELDILADLQEIKGMSICQGKTLDEIARIVTQTMGQHPDNAHTGDMISKISTLIDTGIQSSISSATEATSTCKTQMESYFTTIGRKLEESSLDMIKTCEEKLISAINLAKLEELVIRQEKAAEVTSTAAAEINTHRLEMAKVMEEHRKSLLELYPQEGRRDLESKPGEGEEPIIDDGQNDTEGTKYAAQARQKAQEILTLMETMPFRRMEEHTTSPEHRDGKAAFHTTVHTEICLVCKQQDLGLLYCDTCDDLGGLYHTGCLTLLDTGNRVCEECFQKHQNAKEVNINTSIMEDNTETSKRLGGDQTEKALIGGNTQITEAVARTSSSSEESSQTSTTTKSSTDSPLQQYTPRNQRTKGKGKLPSLTTAIANHDKQTNRITEISPLKTRGQRKQKIKEDAFDSSSNDDLDK